MMMSAQNFTSLLRFCFLHAAPVKDIDKKSCKNLYKFHRMYQSFTSPPLAKEENDIFQLSFLRDEELQCKFFSVRDAQSVYVQFLPH